MQTSTRLANSRRDFLTKSAGGILALGGPMILTPRKASAQAGPVDPGVLSNVVDSAVALYGSGFSDGDLYGQLSSSIVALQSNMAATGMNATLASIIPGAAASGACQFNGNWQNLTYDAAQRAGYRNLPYDFFRPAPQAQLRLDQIQAVNVAQRLDQVQYNAYRFTSLRGGVLSARNQAPHAGAGTGIVDLLLGKPNPANGFKKAMSSTQRLMGTAAAGLLALGGAGVAFIGSTFLAGAIGSFVFGFGIGLFFAGLAIAGYFAFSSLLRDGPIEDVSSKWWDVTFDQWPT
jgi:hypothetical protein